MVKIRYDSKIDALYIDLAQGKYDKSKKITESIVVDLTNSGKVLGIEILDASENIQQFDPSNLISNLQARTTKRVYAG